MYPYVFTIFSNFFFALGSQFYTHYTKKFSSSWMNAYKSILGLMLFLITTIILEGFHLENYVSFIFFMSSGFLGLGLGDLFLFNAFKEMGTGRTLVVFGFHPIIIGLFSYLLFSQDLEPKAFIAIFFFLFCLFTFSFESFKKSGSWQIRGILFALLGVSLDATGVILTKYAFLSSPLVGTFEGNVYRAIGAILFYFFLNFIFPFSFFPRMKTLNLKSKIYVSLGTLFGTYLSLACFLYAVKNARSLAMVTAISVTSVLFSSIMESFIEKKKPTKYFMLAFLFFLVGMAVIVFK